ncbi:MAG: hypothetical protein QF609_06880 [Gammaproteobacteria bacterium]|nr:hypothetical protein [Gammaproteobacteria bacterium]
MNVIAVMPAPDRVRGDGSGIQSELPLSTAHYHRRSWARIAPAILSHFLHLMCMDARMPRWQDAKERPWRSLSQE